MCELSLRWHRLFVMILIGGFLIALPASSADAEAQSCAITQIAIPSTAPFIGNDMTNLSSSDCRDPIKGSWLPRPNYADIYQANLPIDANVTFYLYSMHFSARLRLLSADQSELKNNSASRRGAYAKISSALSKGTYHVVATESSGWWSRKTGDYILVVSAEAANDAYAPFDSPTRGVNGKRKSGYNCHAPYPDNSEDGNRYIDVRNTAKLIPRKRLLTRELFQFWDVEVVDRCANYAYHDYGDDDFWPNGHTGWDIQTTNRKERTVAFYSLTQGRAVLAGGDSWNTIAVHDEHLQMTVLYLHASKVLVKLGEVVEVGEALGVQGRFDVTGRTTGVHVHVGVRKGELDSIPRSSVHEAPCSRYGPCFGTQVDPISDDFLYNWVTGGY